MALLTSTRVNAADALLHRSPYSSLSSHHSVAGGGAGGGAAAGYRICIDCGWLVSSEDFPDVKACPVCKSPRSRFKAYKGAVKGRPNNSGGAMKQRFQAREW